MAARAVAEGEAGPDLPDRPAGADIADAHATGASGPAGPRPAAPAAAGRAGAALLRRPTRSGRRHPVALLTRLGQDARAPRDTQGSASCSATTGPSPGSSECPRASGTRGEPTVKEPNVSANDQQVRALLTAAADDLPPGIDLLAGFRAGRAGAPGPEPGGAGHDRGRRRGRRHRGNAVAAARILAAHRADQRGLPHGGVRLSLQRDPGLEASAGERIAASPGGPHHRSIRPGARSWRGDPRRRRADPVRGRVRLRRYAPNRPAQPGKPWLKAPSQLRWDPATADGQLRVTAGLDSVAEACLGPCRAARVGQHRPAHRPRSGPGWTGTGYAFSVRLAFGSASGGAPTVTAGRHRRRRPARPGTRPHGDYPVPAEAPATAGRVSARMTFSDFGAPVPVIAPLASEVFALATIRFGVGPAPSRITARASRACG